MFVTMWLAMRFKRRTGYYLILTIAITRRYISFVEARSLS